MQRLSDRRRVRWPNEGVCPGHDLWLLLRGLADRRDHGAQRQAAGGRGLLDPVPDSCMVAQAHTGGRKRDVLLDLVVLKVTIGVVQSDGGRV